MDVESRMNLSLDDIIKGTRDASKTKKKPKQIGKAKVKLARSAQPVTQGGQSAAGKKQGRQNGRRALAVQTKGLKPKTPAGKRTVVTVNVKGSGAAANPRRTVTNRAAVNNVAVTIKNNQAVRQVQRPVQPAYGHQPTYGHQQARPAGYATQASRVQPSPSYGYGPRNLLPSGEYAAAAATAAAAPRAAAAPASQHRASANANTDYGVSRRMLGNALSGRVRVTAQRRNTQMVDYDNTKTGLRMDYGR